MFEVVKFDLDAAAESAWERAHFAGLSVGASCWGT